ncbi:MAG TPA: protein kinase [Thermoanaerobaculia bacterium]|jgi:Tol biopolymer transport system component|nr:protein kinase [Thermoanaerobaculia bacterium]
MRLAPGNRLGPYEIVAVLGAGGMGEVYRARDPRLGREVAVKVMPEQLAGHPESLARFEREARAVAALSHPHIVALHDFGRDEASGCVYAVSELLAGETLRERLAGGPLPPRKVAELGVQAARGLAAAHDKGIVHRDLKPENLFLTHAGHVKILDFGLARAGIDAAADGGETQAPTLSRHTDPGTVLGTVGYMAPEQVRGEPADPRADLFALGAVLWEAATGLRPFHRDTSAETMTAILREEPAELASGRRLPPELERVLRHCLEKRREERFQSARDLAFDLESLTHGSSSSAARAAALAAGAASRRRRLVAVAGGSLLLAALLAGAWLLGRRSAPLPPTPSPVKVRPLTFSGHDFQPTVSPDGRLVAFTSTRDGTSRIWLLDLATGGEQPLTDGPDERPRFTPDGASILFARTGTTTSIYRQSVVGGEVRKVLSDAQEAESSPDGRQLAFSRLVHSEREGVAGLVLLTDASARGERVMARFANAAPVGLRFSPAGERIVATITTLGNPAIGGYLAVIDVGSGKVTHIDPPHAPAAVTSAVWAADGRALLFAYSDTVVAGFAGSNNLVVWQPVAGGPVRPAFWQRDLFSGAFAGSIIAPAGAGRIVLETSVGREALQEHALVAGGQRMRPLSGVGGNAIDRQPVYSPDGGTVLFSSTRGGNLDLWTMDLASGTVRRLTDDPADDWDPAFTPDGKGVLWSSDRGGHLEIWTADVDGSRARQVTRDGLDAENPTMTRDGAWIVYATSNPAHPGVWRIRPDGRDATLLYRGAGSVPEVSPDGRLAIFIDAHPATGLNLVRVLEVASGRLLPFSIDVPRRGPASLANNVGRGRWLPDGNRIAFIGADEAKQLAVYLEDFHPGGAGATGWRNLTAGTGRGAAESFGISPDGAHMVVAWSDETRAVLLAEGLPEVAAPAGPR